MQSIPPLNPSAVPQKKKSGCLFYGCLTVLIVLLLVVVGSYFGIRYFISSMVEQYSSETRISIPVSSRSSINYSDLGTRVENFVQGVRGEEGPMELVLTAEELNVLINNHPDLGELKDFAHFDLKDDRISGQLSIPLDGFGYPGRYFNGEGEFEIKMENGILEIFISSLRVKGAEVPRTVIEAMNQKNWAAKLYEDQKSIDFMKKIEQIKIEEGRLIVKRRKAGE